ncbi:MAG: LptA/OstA family protein [Hyphomonadaceae bacterium]
MNILNAFGFAAAAALSWAALAAPASAQLSAGGGPISYSADNLEYFDNERRLVLTGDVDVVQGDARLRSDTLTLLFAAGSGGGAATGPAGVGAGDIQRMVAEGQVYYVRPEQQARGDRAVYETSTDSVTFTGNVVIASQTNVLRGETLVMQIGTGRATLSPGGRGRVQGVLRQGSGGGQ